MFGVDAPEIKEPDNEFIPTKGIRNLYGQNTIIFLKSMKLKNVKWKTITTDIYNRKIAKIKINNQDLGLTLLKNSLVRVAYISAKKNNPFYTNDYLYYRQILNEQWKAYKSNLNIWKYLKEWKKIFPK